MYERASTCCKCVVNGTATELWFRRLIRRLFEDSDFTSAQKRYCDLKAKLSTAKPLARPLGTQSSSKERGEDRSRDGESHVGDTGHKSGRHLAPVELHGGSSTMGPCVNKQGARCSNKGFLPMSTAEYLSLLDWTARQSKAGKPGATPKQFAPLFDRLGISADIWCRLVKDFGKLFSVVAGQPQRIDGHRSKGSSRCCRIRQEALELMASVQKAW